MRAREQAEKSGRPWTVGDASARANSPTGGERMNHRGALASIVPSNGATNRRPTSSAAKMGGRMDYGGEVQA